MIFPPHCNFQHIISCTMLINTKSYKNKNKYIILNAILWWGKCTAIQTQRYNVKRDELGCNQTKQSNQMWKEPKSIALTANCFSHRLIFHACLFHLQNQRHVLFQHTHTHATKSVALKALCLSFSLSGCSDLSPNPTNIPALPERGTATLMHSNLDKAQHFCVYSCFLLFTAVIDICETTALFMFFVK